MFAGLLRRRAVPTAPREAIPSDGRNTPTPDAGYEAIPRMQRLAQELIAASRQPRSQWREPSVFFMDRRRQAELEAARPGGVAPQFPTLSAIIAEELPKLSASSDIRRVARAVPGLKAAAEALSTRCPAAKELVELLNVPDEENVTILHPDHGIGLRLLVSGIVDVGQLHILFLHIADEFLPGVTVPGHVVRAASELHPVPELDSTVMESRFQLFTPSALRSDGTLPSGFKGSDHWLWPSMPFSAIPLRNGERVVLLGPAAFPATWEVSRRFPGLAAEARLLAVLSTEQVAELLTKLTGNPIPAREKPGSVTCRAA